MNDDQPTTLCPHDGAPRPRSHRYPQALCNACGDRSTDLAGRPIEMYNVSMSGGFKALHADDGTQCDQVTADGQVLIDGVRYRAGEAYMGGIVVQPKDSPHR
ncbi:hypothetical protein [Streptomyces phytophilus]|uniref:hypothetical protein n=1 Tax=Streptomyces phytophilus TaxID=722715 RepID=UPI0015F01545|nr:hypothetical protein [Streptomyces phytophilus]